MSPPPGSAYSSVVDDLSKDKNFNLSDYPENTNDYSIRLIQIAESDEGELLLYIYQPSAGALDLTLTSIRFSPDIEAADMRDYAVTLLNSRGTLLKYKVEGFTVKENATRYYNITAVHRRYDKLADGGTISGNQYKRIAVKFAQLWTAVTVNGTVTYSMEEVDVVELTGLYYKSVRVKDGYNFVSKYSCDSHFIAFTTDVRIDKLLEADVSFKYRSVDVGIYDHPDYGEWHSETKTVKYKEQGGTSGNHWSNEKRTWDRIMSAKEYVDNFPSELPDELKSEIKKQQWVLSYYETQYESDTGGVFGWLNYVTGGAIFGRNLYHYTEVSDVTVLRLKFITDGEVYNLGVVSNIGGTSDIVYDEGGGFWDDVKDKINDVKDKISSSLKDLLNKGKSILGKVQWWQWLVIALTVIIVAVVVICVIFPAAGKLIIKLITAPFKAISNAVKKRKEEKAQREAANKKKQKGKKK
ncbi:MAG: hypothetical protein K2I30_05630 [Clostridia bacterium]|nr:hypothetical protein [Clostridia bacterium]